MHKLCATAALLFGAATASAAVVATQSYSTAQVRPPNVDAVNAPAAWAVTRGEGVNVAVLDSGIDFFHEELSAAYAGGFNTFDPALPPWDDNHHGTHVAGIIAAADNGVGVVGVAPGVRLWAVKIFDAQGGSTEQNAIDGLRWVTAKKRELGGRWIINMSFSDDAPSSELRAAIADAAAAGMLLVASSGAGPGPLGYPASDPNVLSVGAVDANGIRLSISSYGPSLGLVAPGVDILSTAPTGTQAGSVLTIDGRPSMPAVPFGGTPHGRFGGRIIDCGDGACPDVVSGNIALIERGTMPLHEAIHNADLLGASGVVIFQQAGGAFVTFPRDTAPYTLEAWPFVVGLRRDDGLALKALAGTMAAVEVRSEDYLRLTGTSQATPHVTGAAALVWSSAPNATASQVAAALLATARDLGPPGVDDEYGRGMVNALGAIQRIVFGVRQRSCRF